MTGSSLSPPHTHTQAVTCHRDVTMMTVLNQGWGDGVHAHTFLKKELETVAKSKAC